MYNMLIVKQPLRVSYVTIGFVQYTNGLLARDLY